jgi:hypothetical protein
MVLGLSRLATAYSSMKRWQNSASVGIFGASGFSSLSS